MIIAPTRATALYEANRLDARFHASPAVRLRPVLSRAKKVSLRRIGEYGDVRAPNRFKRTYAAPGEEYIPYLRPYDVFEYLPPEADRLSVTRTENLDTYRINSGDLLQTCSGRNLGPLTIADNYLARFVLSHDMVRITIADESERYYTLAFLQSAVGQQLLRGDLNGSVIDHITVDQVAAIQVPFVASIISKVAALMRDATATREQSRITLHKSVEALNKAFDTSHDKPLREGWAVKGRDAGHQTRRRVSLDSRPNDQGEGSRRRRCRTRRGCDDHKAGRSIQDVLCRPWARDTTRVRYTASPGRCHWGKKHFV
ncbi:hypothetical protein [Mycobacterium hubeiense]|uniref:hypothetical protein n=1 Tax=Mycobacterium hubeiense TaxID=1867256 RepID=UPI000C7EEF6A|nr:hypothetical protein [Mycobacterium sp. QGD 101]